MNRLVSGLWILGCTVVLALIAAAPASAQVTRVEPRQSIGFNLGYFAVRGQDSRVEGDVLWEDLSSLAFEVKISTPQRSAENGCSTSPTTSKQPSERASTSARFQACTSASPMPAAPRSNRISSSGSFPSRRRFGSSRWAGVRSSRISAPASAGSTGATVKQESSWILPTTRFFQLDTSRAEIRPVL